MRDVATTIRIVESLHEQIKREAKEIGVSYNAHVMELLYLGIRTRNGKIFILREEK